MLLYGFRKLELNGLLLLYSHHHFHRFTASIPIHSLEEKTANPLHLCSTDESQFWNNMEVNQDNWVNYYLI